MKFPWSDNWWIEGNKAWFCAGEISALFCVDLNSEQCDLVEWIPECNIIALQLYSYCIKRNDIIFCIPNTEKFVWFYDVEKSDWGKIEVGNVNQLLMCIAAYDTKNDRIWVWEDERGRVFEINLKTKNVENKYQLSEGINMSFYECILAEDGVYCVSGYKVYCINNNNLHTYEISGVKTELCTICCVGCNFWMSGYSKEIYIWNPEQGIIKVISEFPKHFGFYHFRKGEIPVVDCDSLFCDEFPFYISSILLGKYIWYIPFRSDEIVYIDKDTYEVNLLEIEDEKETKESIENRIKAHKYLVQYVREDRYIGIYSLKNGWIFEVDTTELCVIHKDYKLKDEALLTIGKKLVDYNSKMILKECKEIERTLYSMLLREKCDKKENVIQNIGDSIYYTLDKGE